MASSPPKFEIIVNAQKKSWDAAKIDYEQVVNLAFPPPHGQNEIFTVQYSRGPDENRSGTLAAGQTAFVKSGMIFDVSRTDRSQP